MKRYQITVSGRTFDVRLLSDPRQEQVQVAVNGQAFTVKVKAAPVEEVKAGAAPSDIAAPPSVAEAAAPTGTMVTAPLPGVIKMIAVQPDQQVSAGDKLVVIEAMKMDNVIRASRAGVIGTIHVAEGRQVAHGEPLLEYQR